MEMDYLTVLYTRLGANFRDLHAKDSSLFRKRLIINIIGKIYIFLSNNSQSPLFNIPFSPFLPFNKYYNKHLNRYLNKLNSNTIKAL